MKILCLSYKRFWYWSSHLNFKGQQFVSIKIDYIYTVPRSSSIGNQYIEIGYQLHPSVILNEKKTSVFKQVLCKKGSVRLYHLFRFFLNIKFVKCSTEMCPQMKSVIRSKEVLNLFFNLNQTYFLFTETVLFFSFQHWNKGSFLYHKAIESK